MARKTKKTDAELEAKIAAARAEDAALGALRNEVTAIVAAARAEFERQADAYTATHYTCPVLFIKVNLAHAAWEAAKADAEAALRPFFRVGDLNTFDGPFVPAQAGADFDPKVYPGR